MNIFQSANLKLEGFINDNLSNYHKLRQFDYGEKDHSNVSQISKYTTHRILYEYEIIEKLRLIDKKKKFTDEIIWRIYWKGYLENYKSVWDEYKSCNYNYFDSGIFDKAIKGSTGIDCFDTWVEELREKNYLHNHSRMYFASIWIFLLRLPWQKGARFFMSHLIDGDAASNTLSWRWVAGLHTNNKPYIPSKENINKYTLNRFNEVNINSDEDTILIQKRIHKPSKIKSNNKDCKSNNLIMFDNDMYILNRYELFNSYSKVLIILHHNFKTSLKLNEKVITFKESIVNDTGKLIPNSEIVSNKDLDILLDDFECIDILYPGIGYNLDLINNYCNQKRIKINYILREEDIRYWHNANSGFYKFKKYFYQVNKLKYEQS